MKITRFQWLSIVFATVFITYVKSGVMTSGDSRWFIPEAMSIIHEGNLNLDEYRDRIESDEYYGVEEINGHFYNYFPIGTALISLPVVWSIDQVISKAGGMSFKNYIKDNRAEKTERFIASFFMALASVIIFLITERRLGGVIGPLLLVSVFAFGTSAWSEASRALWQHGPAMLVLTVAFFIFLKAEEKESYLSFLGPVMAFAYLIRPTSIIPYTVFAAYIFLKHRRYFIRFVFMSMLVIVPFVALNLSLYGSILPSYFGASRLAANHSFPAALACNLISPSRGLFVFSPILMLSCYGVFLSLRKGGIKTIDMLLITIILIHWILISSVPMWWGGFCIGPRYFTEMIPFFVYLLIPVVEELMNSQGFRFFAIASVFAVLSAISFYIHYTSATNWSVAMWNETPVSIDENPSRVWDWHDIQFMRRQDRTP